MRDTPCGTAVAKHFAEWESAEGVPICSVHVFLAAKNVNRWYESARLRALPHSAKCLATAVPARVVSAIRMSRRAFGRVPTLALPIDQPRRRLGPKFLPTMAPRS